MFLVCNGCDEFLLFLFFFFNDTATTEIYTLSLHDALPICFSRHCGSPHGRDLGRGLPDGPAWGLRHRGLRASAIQPSRWWCFVVRWPSAVSWISTWRSSGRGFGPFNGS